MTKPDYVVLPRNALFEFLGKVALPPWQDHDGRLIGTHIDCAPIAQEITAWIDQNELTDLYDVG